MDSCSAEVVVEEYLEATHLSLLTRRWRWWQPRASTPCWWPWSPSWSSQLSESSSGEDGGREGQQDLVDDQLEDHRLGMSPCTTLASPQGWDSGRYWKQICETRKIWFEVKKSKIQLRWWQEQTSDWFWRSDERQDLAAQTIWNRCYEEGMPLFKN